MQFKLLKNIYIAALRRARFDPAFAKPSADRYDCRACPDQSRRAITHHQRVKKIICIFLLHSVRWLQHTVLFAALSVCAMHVSSDDEAKKPKSLQKNFEMQNFALGAQPTQKPPATKEDSTESDDQDLAQELAINHLSSLNYDRTTWSPSIYTLASVEKDK